MPTKTEQRIVDILGWIWLAAVILVLAFGGSTALALVSGVGIATAAGYFGYRYRRHPKMFRGKGR